VQPKRVIAEPSGFSSSFGKRLAPASTAPCSTNEKYAMLPDTPSVEQLSQVIAQVTGPAFLLGAVAGFVSLLISRMNRIIDRSQSLDAIKDDDAVRVKLKSDIPRLKRRALLLNKAIFFSTVSAIVTCVLVIVAFATAYYNIRHEYGVGLLFVLALAFFIVSLVNLARETHIALHEFDYLNSS
jgi:ABC-type spermidine/putrescine transport system permease subunit I